MFMYSYSESPVVQKKIKQIQSTVRREPKQDRSRHKVELILEAAVRLLEQGGLEALNTNAVADKAGVSIGTLYQFFPNKAAILNKLAATEVERMTQRVISAMKDHTVASPTERVAAIVKAVAESYGKRQAAHRVVMAHSIAQGGANKMAPLFAQLRAVLAEERTNGQYRAAMSAGDAFVVAHAFGGVLRAMTSEFDAPHQAEIEKSLVRLVTRFLEIPA